MSDEPYDLGELVRRLRGVYTILVNDGAGPLNGTYTYTNTFDVPRIQLRAADEIERLTREVEETREQLKQQTKSFCTHCGTLFPKGKEGVEQFRLHIAECNAHPLHPMAREIERLRRAAAAATQTIASLRETIANLHAIQSENKQEIERLTLALACIALHEIGDNHSSDFANESLGWKRTSELWDIVNEAKKGGGSE